MTQKWIPISEQEPPEDTQIIVKIDIGTIDGGSACELGYPCLFTVGTKYRRFGEDSWNFQNTKMVDGGFVIAWAPLPED